MKFLKMASLALLIIALFANFTGLASATLISHVDSTVIFDANSGEYTYGYDVHNEVASNENIWAFTVYPGAEVFDILSPTGWDWILTDYLTFVRWPSENPTYDIVPGVSKGGFGFKSYVSEAIVAYDVEGSYNTIYTGETVGPAAVPEPDTFILLSAGLAGLLSYVVMWKRRSQQ